MPMKYFLYIALSLAFFIACQDFKKEEFNEEDLHQSSDTIEVELISPTKSQFDTTFSGIRIHSMDVFDEPSNEIVEFIEDKSEESRIAIELIKERGLNVFYSVNNDEVINYSSKSPIPLLGGNNVLLMFATNAKGISIKNKKAVYLKNHFLGEGNANFDNSSPHLLYHLPKESTIKIIEEGLLLDFIVVNAELHKNAYSVEVFLDEITFSLSAWQAYRIDGLAEGEHRIKIRLIDKEGNWVPGPFNDSGYRRFEIRNNSNV